MCGAVRPFLSTPRARVKGPSQYSTFNWLNLLPRPFVREPWLIGQHFWLNFWLRFGNIGCLFGWFHDCYFLREKNLCEKKRVLQVYTFLYIFFVLVQRRVWCGTVFAHFIFYPISVFIVYDIPTSRFCSREQNKKAHNLKIHTFLSVTSCSFLLMS